MLSALSNVVNLALIFFPPSTYKYICFHIFLQNLNFHLSNIIFHEKTTEKQTSDQKYPWPFAFVDDQIVLFVQRLNIRAAFEKLYICWEHSAVGLGKGWWSVKSGIIQISELPSMAGFSWEVEWGQICQDPLSFCGRVHWQWAAVLCVDLDENRGGADLSKAAISRWNKRCWGKCRQAFQSWMGFSGGEEEDQKVCQFGTKKFTSEKNWDWKLTRLCPLLAAVGELMVNDYEKQVSSNWQLWCQVLGPNNFIKISLMQLSCVSNILRAII